MLSVAPFVRHLLLCRSGASSLSISTFVYSADTAPSISLSPYCCVFHLFLYIDVTILLVAQLADWSAVDTALVLAELLVADQHNCSFDCGDCLPASGVAGVLGFSTRFFSLLALFTCMYAVSVNQCLVWLTINAIAWSGLSLYSPQSLRWRTSLDALRSTSGRRMWGGHIARLGVMVCHQNDVVIIWHHLLLSSSGSFGVWFRLALGENFRHILSFCSITADPGLPIFNVEPFPCSTNLVIGSHRIELSFVSCPIRQREFCRYFWISLSLCNLRFHGISFWPAGVLSHLSWLVSVAEKMSNCQIVEDICKTYATQLNLWDAIVGRAGLPIMLSYVLPWFWVNTLSGIRQGDCFPLLLSQLAFPLD